ncbi:MAG: M28 family peptidase [Flavobacteriia bacterium]|jgi:Zn-dependent M28 family amino/carboxypeptidase|nr:M28 family peptidase [Flavobacteriia bacterium]
MQDYLSRIVHEIAVSNYRNANGERWYEFMEYLSAEIETLGYSVDVQSWRDESGRMFKNFIVRLTGKTEDTYVIGAHYDSFEETPGADDNASAVAVLLGILKSLDPNLVPNYTWEFVFYACEEPPFFGSENMGSYHHARHLNPERIKCMICLEMVGYFSEDKNSQEYPFWALKWWFGNRGNFLLGVSNPASRKEARNVLKALHKGRPSFYKNLMLPFPISGLDWSDHRNYWKFGIPALMLTDTAMYRNKNYHTLDDLPETLNYEKMALLTSDLVAFIKME